MNAYTNFKMDSNREQEFTLVLRFKSDDGESEVYRDVDNKIIEIGCDDRIVAEGSEPKVQWRFSYSDWDSYYERFLAQYESKLLVLKIKYVHPAYQSRFFGGLSHSIESMKVSALSKGGHSERLKFVSK